jgi:hypothetical protein
MLGVGKFLNLIPKAAIGDVAVFGFRYKRVCSDPAKPSGPVGSIQLYLPNGQGTLISTASIGSLYNEISYSIEFRFKKTSNTTYDFDYFVNKTKMGTTVSSVVTTYSATFFDFASTYYETHTPHLTMWVDDKDTKVIMSDIFFGYDKVTDTVKTDLAGPLDVRHHLASVSTSTDNWKVVDGTPLSVVKPDISILDAIGDNDVGLHPTKYADMNLAMTDSSGELGTFKFENVPDGNYLGYALDLFVNQPQSQSGDLYTEVLEGTNPTPVASATTSNITRVPGNFQQVNLTTQSKPVNQDNLHAIKLNVGSKKIIPV